MATASEKEVLRGDSLCEALITKFSASKDPCGKIDCERLADAALQLCGVYELVFGVGLVSRHLKQDIINSSGRMRAAAEKLAAAEGGGLRVTVDLLIEHELRTIGIPKMRKDTKGGVRNLLWMQRALHFVFTLLKNVFEDMKEATPREAALDAYEKVLKPYHGIFVANIVSLAFSLAPSKRDLFVRLGFGDCSEDEALEKFMCVDGVVRPVIEQVGKLLADNDCNFPDKA